MQFIIAVSCLLALSGQARVFANDGLVYAPGHASAVHYPTPNYEFDYTVRDPHTGDNKVQWERRNGGVVTGAYSLLEPGGSVRVVKYRADDKTGFSVVMDRIGPKAHPVTPPIYRAAIPSLGHATTPYVVGRVAGHGGLASAPLYTTPHTGGPTSSIYVYKAPNPIVRDIAPSPVIPAPLPLPVPVPSVHPAPYMPPPVMPIPAPSMHQPPYIPPTRIPMSMPQPYGSLRGHGHGSLSPNYLYSSPLSYY